LVKPRRDKQMVSLVPLIAWLAAILTAWIAIGRAKPPRTVPLIADRLLRAVLVFPLGLLSLWAAFGHIFFPEMAARAIGWQTSPFQFEVGVANLGIELAALHAALRGRDAQIGVGLVAAGFLGGAGVGHIRDIVQSGNLAPGNGGPILFTDFLTPIAIFVLLYLPRGHQPSPAAASRQ
jgi:hypothetical protein